MGKTRCGAEAIKEYVKRGLAKRIALIGETPRDARDTMIEGDSGILNLYPEGKKPDYHPGQATKRTLVWPNGAEAYKYGGSKPDGLRGAQHDLAWADELASWAYPRDAWNNLQLTMRIGEHPQTVVTTTPKPIKLLRELRDRAKKEDSVVMTRGSTYDNKDNLAKPFFQSIVNQYEGSDLGRQEVEGEIIDDSEDALWSREDFEDIELDPEDVPGDYPHECEMEKIVVAIDPAISNKDTSDETGIVAAGMRGSTGYVLEDLSGKYSSKKWAEVAIDAYEKYQADQIIGEVNQGGDLVESTLRTVAQNVSYKGVRASRGKQTRAQPVSSLYQQGRIYHIGSLPDLISQCCTWEPKSGMDSPDRVDALTWAFTELMLGESKRKQRWQDYL